MRTFEKTPNKTKKERPLDDVTLGVVHYTGSMSMEGTVSWFKNPNAKVSSHYVIGRRGEVTQFGQRFSTLWHAGKSEWAGRKWCNKFSIGYELVGTATSGFMTDQMSALRDLIIEDLSFCPIEAIVGHEQIAPGRKVDPGSGFDWQWLQNELEGADWPVPLQQNKLCHIGTKAYPSFVNGGFDLPLGEATMNISEPIAEPSMPKGKDDSWWKIW